MTYAVGSKVNVTVTLTNIFKFEVPGFGYYARTTTKRIYKFVDAEGCVLVWKTTGYLSISDKVPEPNKGAVVTISGKVKGFSNYKGEDQTELERVKLVKVVTDTETLVEASKGTKNTVEIKDTDKVVEMPYSNYKNHYADCKTVPGSYKIGDGYQPPMIKVIIPEGRMKKSGVRGEHFNGYELINEEGKKVTYCAVSVENAIKRANKEHPGCKWELNHVYWYRSVHRIW